MMTEKNWHNIRDRVQAAAKIVVVAVDTTADVPISSSIIHCMMNRRELAIGMLSGRIEINEHSIAFFERFNDDLKKLLAL